MTRGIFIAGNESALLNAVEIEAARRVEHFAAALIPVRLSGVEPSARPENRRVPAHEPSGAGPQAAAEKARISLQWNPGSPISARTLVLAAENRLEHIDEAILVCDPPAVRRAAVDLSLTDIEILVNDYIKCWFFVVKELTAMFEARRSGTLALVYPDAGSGGGKDEAAGVFRSTSLAAFRVLVQGLLVPAVKASYITLGFTSAETGDEAGFAAFVIKTLEEGTARNNGKLHKYGKLKFF
jgi:hypothetical protein